MDGFCREEVALYKYLSHHLRMKNQSERQRHNALCASYYWKNPVVNREKRRVAEEKKRRARGVLKGKLSVSTSESIHKGVANMTRMQSTKLAAARFMAKPLHKDLLHELSAKVVK